LTQNDEADRVPYDNNAIELLLFAKKRSAPNRRGSSSTATMPSHVHGVPAAAINVVAPNRNNRQWWVRGATLAQYAFDSQVRRKTIKVRSLAGLMRSGKTVQHHT